MLLRCDETCDSAAAALPSVRLMSKSEGCGAPSGRVLFLVGSLSAPRLAASLPPLSPLTTCSAGKPADMDLGLPTQAEEKKRPEVARCSGREGLSPPVLGNGSTPHDRDGLGHASLMGQGWEECNAGVEGGDKRCRGPQSAISRHHVHLRALVSASG